MYIRHIDCHEFEDKIMVIFMHYVDLKHPVYKLIYLHLCTEMFHKVSPIIIHNKEFHRLPLYTTSFYSILSLLTSLWNTIPILTD